MEEGGGLFDLRRDCPDVRLVVRSRDEAMSKKSELKAELERIGYSLNGSHLTRQARTATFSTFANAMRELGLGIRSAKQIGERHLKAFVAHRVASVIGARTLAKELSHLRAVLVHVGKQGFVASPACSNRALGIAQGTRVGTKSAMSDAALNAFHSSMALLGRPGIGATMTLQRELGLRAAEAIRAGQADTLTRWKQELEERGYVHVIAGTKGGCARDVRPADAGRALVAIRDAMAVLESTGQRYLVIRADGSTPANLLQAENIYRNLCHRAGIQSHSARYAFAQERFRAYREQQGFSRREARAATSLDLGHGDGRGRYIASVYVRES
jgi:hypothetical protein